MPTIAEALQEGLGHHRAGRLGEAEKMYRQVLQMYPRHASAVHLLGLIAYQIGQVDKALECLTAAVKYDAFNAVFSADLGEIYRELGKVPEAIAACEKALKLNPEMAAVHVCMGQLHLSQDHREAAIASFRQAIDIDPKLATAHAKLGLALRAAGQLPEASAACERAVQLAPNDAEHYLGLGAALYDQGKLLDAIACHQKALKLRPGLVKAKYHCALARLALGDFANGWREFDARLAFPGFVRNNYVLPMWTPGERDVRSVLIHAEHGVADTLQFIRYLPQVEAREVEVHLDVPAELVPLLTDSGFKNLHAGGVAPEECQRQAPLLSLPRLMGTTGESIPAEIPYLSAASDRVAQWRAKLAPIEGLRVGIHWQGAANDYCDQARSIPLAHFASLAAIAGVQLVNLQTSETLDSPADRAAPFALHDLALAGDDPGSTLANLAAAIKNLDLVISADTTVAHLAGGLGAPVWVALPVGPDWRWLQIRGDSPWYPTMRLFRQKQFGGWVDVFSRMASELAAVAAGGRASRSQS